MSRLWYLLPDLTRSISVRASLFMIENKDQVDDHEKSVLNHNWKKDCEVNGSDWEKKNAWGEWNGE